MVQFMIYLLETGICLSLLYLAYWLFLRKETYFNFNRIFLVASIALSLIVPALNLNLVIPIGSPMEQTTTGIENIRDSYEEMIRWINADFGTEPGERHAIGASPGGLRGADEGGTAPTSDDRAIKANSGISLSGILLIIYIGGVGWFLARFIYLLIRLYLLAKRNRVSRQDGFRMVEIEEQISPFSFFRFLFINHGSFDESEMDQVLEHEKAHIMQRHTMDHLFAHGLAVFQWFNPIAWQIRNALKTTHEYIADRQVLNRGVERQEYQSLLLQQVIGYHSVELVNNFNLKPIKKRIAMMNKNKSGIPARFKAALVAPFAIIAFLLFADFTLKGSNVMRDPVKALEGLWIKQSLDDFSDKILIRDGVFSFMDGTEVRQYTLEKTFETGPIMLKGPDGVISTKLKHFGYELLFSWNENTETRYSLSKAKNTLDLWLLENKLNLELPAISRYRLLEKENQVYRLGIGLDKTGKAVYSVNGRTTQLALISDLVNQELGRLTAMDAMTATGIFLVDKQVSMQEVNNLREELKKAERYRIAEGGYPHGDIELSPLLYHSVALPRLLPPKDAKILDKAEMEKRGGKVHTIDLSERNTSPREVDQKLREFIRSCGDSKYVLSLEYDGQIPYGQYVETVDMIYNVVYAFRGDLALEKYGAPYEKLGPELQKEIRKAYPMALSELMK